MFWVCPFCGLVLPTSDRRNKHVRRKHGVTHLETRLDYEFEGLSYYYRPRSSEEEVDAMMKYINPSLSSAIKRYDERVLDLAKVIKEATEKGEKERIEKEKKRNKGQTGSKEEEEEEEEEGMPLLSAGSKRVTNLLAE